MWCLHRSQHGHGLSPHTQPATERRRQAEAVAEARQSETRGRGSLVENTGSESGGAPAGARVRRVRQWLHRQGLVSGTRLSGTGARDEVVVDRGPADKHGLGRRRGEGNVAGGRGEGPEPRGGGDGRGGGELEPEGEFCWGWWFYRQR